MFNCFADADARAQARVGPGLATPLTLVSNPSIQWPKLTNINGYSKTNLPIWLLQAGLLLHGREEVNQNGNRIGDGNGTVSVPVVLSQWQLQYWVLRDCWSRRVRWTLHRNSTWVFKPRWCCSLQYTKLHDLFKFYNAHGHSPWLNCEWAIGLALSLSVYTWNHNSLICWSPLRFSLLAAGYQLMQCRPLSQLAMQVASMPLDSLSHNP